MKENRSDMKSILRNTFCDIFEGQPCVFVSAPGRVNLIGEHTDYNDGFVLPMAIDRRIYVASSPRTDGNMCIYSWNYEQKVEFSVKELSIDTERRWVNYVKGVLATFTEEGFETGLGANLVIGGDVPLESGLSSSAALEMSVAFSFNQLFNLGIQVDKLVDLAQKAENDFVGVPCGIMDQFTSGLAKKNHALFLDCQSLQYEHIPLDLDRCNIVICNSNKPRGLANSAYHQRRAECQEGVKILNKYMPDVETLRDVGIKDLMRQWEKLPHPIGVRCGHVVSENQRVLNGVHALKVGDMNKFGQLMNESHESLNHLYEVSCSELDSLVTIARNVSGVLGARLTGAGFGGCTVNLVEKESVPIFKQKIFDIYPKETGLQPEIYVSQAVEGVKIE
ncbi:MAG: galactokinase [Gemmatimonadota bacterium]|nr:MAG: galactokinase [Gemmatimonadota bacterium]